MKAYSVKHTTDT